MKVWKHNNLLYHHLFTLYYFYICIQLIVLRLKKDGLKSPIDYISLHLHHFNYIKVLIIVLKLNFPIINKNISIFFILNKFFNLINMNENEININKTMK